MYIGQVSDAQVFLFAVAVLGTFLALAVISYASWLFQQERNGPSPYSGLPLMSGSRLPYSSAKKVERYLKRLHQYENRPFNMRLAAICKETGRIFPNSKKWLNYEVNWDFLQKAYPGHYVSWGSLSLDQQRTVREAHDGHLEGYETLFSSQSSLPKEIEKVFALHELGPLYVDIDTKVLLGWKKVPDITLEVLIVQKPVKIISVTVPKERQPEKKEKQDQKK